MGNSHIIIDMFLHSCHPIIYCTWNILSFIPYITLKAMLYLYFISNDSYGRGGLTLTVYPVLSLSAFTTHSFSYWKMKYSLGIRVKPLFKDPPFSTHLYYETLHSAAPCIMRPSFVSPKRAIQLSLSPL